MKPCTVGCELPWALLMHIDDLGCIFSYTHYGAHITNAKHYSYAKERGGMSVMAIG